MGIRETLNRNPAITTGGTLVIIIAALVVIGWQTMSGGPPKPPTKAWFTTDDGKTWFSDDIQKIAPFSKDGKDAVKIYLFSCKGGKDPFPVYLERCTPEVAKKLAEARTKNTPEAEASIAMMMEGGVEVKRPGDTQWIKNTDYQKFAEVTTIKCPDGNTQDLVPVMP